MENTLHLLDVLSQATPSEACDLASDVMCAHVPGRHCGSCPFDADNFKLLLAELKEAELAIKSYVALTS